MNAKLTAAAVLFSSLLAGSAFADPHHARPTYAPPAPSYAAPVYTAPSYHPAAAPVVTVSYADDDRGRGDRWQHESWERFQREQAERSRAEDGYLARERADYLARYGWNPGIMAWLDQHQADERVQFQASQQMREQEFRNRLAMMERGRHGRHHGDRDGDWD